MSPLWTRPNGDVSSRINGFSRQEIEEIQESTNCSDPGFLRLDQDMLKRFHPDWYAGGLSGILRIIRELFGKPDPRWLVETQLLCAQRAPALVVCTDPFYVAAYSEEFDCIVMLGFHAQQVPPQFRKVGTRLVTLNFDYSIKFGPLAEDIVPGEDAWDGWTNFLPLIGDFLSTETERLDQLREDIRPELWRRVTDCAKHYDYRSRGVRDGRPGFAAQPGSRNHIWRMIDRGF